MKRKILILTLSDLRYDARVRRQVESLKDHYALTLAGFSGEVSKDYALIPLSPIPLTLWRKALTSVFLILRMYGLAHRILYNYLPVVRKKTENQTFELIIANDIETLPIVFSLPGNHKVLYDAHEYAPRHFEDKLMWRIFFQRFNIWMCKKYLPMTAAMTTVSRGLSKEYEKYFQVKPVVVPNATDYYEIDPSPVNNNTIRLVHVGIANPSRKLELMIEMMKLLDDRFSLDLYLLIPGFASSQTKNYIGQLKESIGNARVRIFPPIKSTDIVVTINQYDMGVFLLPPINFNYENTLPNKLFDFIQARLGLAIGPTPEMAEFVLKYENGVVSEDFTPESLAKKLMPLTKTDIEKFKANSIPAAGDFNAQKNSVVIRELVRGILT